MALLPPLNGLNLGTERVQNGSVLELRLESVDGPLAQDARASLAAAQLVARSQYIGALPSMPDPQVLGPTLVGLALAALAKMGVARDAALQAATARSGAEYLRLLDAANEQVEHSPMPAATWPVLVDVLGDELLARLLGVSVSSVRRYASGQRPTPDGVAARLHFLALLVADLSGAYNAYGVRRWFVRPRSALGGAAPVDRLAGGFDPDDESARVVRRLVDGLTASGAA